MRIFCFLALLSGYTGSMSVILNRPLWSILSVQLHATAIVSAACCFIGMLAILLMREKIYIRAEDQPAAAEEPA
jgi:hypothetical protein